MEKSLPLELDRETLIQLAPKQLVEIIVEQAIATTKLNSRILELEQFVEKLKLSRDLDSKTSSKPPSGDILKKSENKHSGSPLGERNSKTEIKRTTRASGKNDVLGLAEWIALNFYVQSFVQVVVVQDFETPWVVKGVKEWL